MVNKVKKNWKQILFVVVCMFALNKCTVSCNRQIEIDRLTNEVAVCDSIIESNNNEIDSLNEVIDRNNFVIENLNKNAQSTAEMQRQKFLLDSLDRINRQRESNQRINELKKLNERLEQATSNK